MSDSSRRHTRLSSAKTRTVLAVIFAVVLAAPVPKGIAALPAPSIPLFSKESAAMSWKTECIGRVLIDMPANRTRTWSSEFDDAAVRRLQRPLSLGAFWSGVETVRDQYARQAHDVHSSRLAHYERMDARKAAFVMGYRSDASFFGPLMWRFAHLGEQHAYEFKQSLSTGNTPPSPELFKPFVDQYSPIFSRIKPLKDGEIPSGEGLCIDGALVSGETGRNAVAALNVEIATGTRLGLGYLENQYQVTRTGAFELLELDRKQAEFGMTFPNEPTAFKEFKVLRRQERTLAGLRGQEFVTRTTLNNGHSFYRFVWALKGGEQSILEPSVRIHLNTPKNVLNPDGSASAPLPPESELVRLWDSVLATFRLRPGALPAGQVLRAVN